MCNMCLQIDWWCKKFTKKKKLRINKRERLAAQALCTKKKSACVERKRKEKAKREKKKGELGFEALARRLRGQMVSILAQIWGGKSLQSALQSYYSRLCISSLYDALLSILLWWDLNFAFCNPSLLMMMIVLVSQEWCSWWFVLLWASNCC